MISKNVLQSVISKYYLNGLNNQVKWRIKDNTLTIYAGEKGRVCMVELNDFSLADGELGVFDTNKLNKLVNIMNGDLLLTIEKMKTILYMSTQSSLLNDAIRFLTIRLLKDL